MDSTYSVQENISKSGRCFVFKSIQEISLDILSVKIKDKYGRMRETSIDG